LVPEFAAGGIGPGIDRGYDSVLAKLRPKEVVLTQAHQSRAMNMYGGDVFKNIGVPGFERGGVVGNRPMLSNIKASTSANDLTIVLVADEKFADQLVTKGGKQVIKLADESIAEKGQLYSTLRRTLKQA
jgi:hypothetical protein